MNVKKQVVISSVIVALIVGLVGGYFWGYARGGMAVTASYAPKIVEVSKLFPPAPTSMLSLSGQVKSINGSVVTLDVGSLTPDPFAVENFPEVREVTVANAAKITKMVQKDPAELQQEVEAYTKQAVNVSATAGVVPVGPSEGPVPFTEKNISLSDIKMGDMVIVTAGSDIMSAPSFTATAIQDQVTP